MSDQTGATPVRAPLEQQRRRAKELLRAYREGDRAAVDRIRRHLPDRTRITLADAQLALAREQGFVSWARLKRSLEGRESAEPAGADGPAADLPAELRTACERAFERDDAETVRKLLLEHGSRRDWTDAPLFPFGAPALVHAARLGSAAVADVLLEFGADPNRRSDWWAGGWHVLHLARGALAERLIAAGAEPDACGAAHLDRVDLLRRILDGDPDRVHERGGDGATPLHFARSRAVVDLLLERGADPDARDLDHRATPAESMLDRRRRAGRYDLADYLVERGAAADVFLAAALGRTDRLRTLLEDDPSQLALRTGHGRYGEQPPSSFHVYTWTIGPELTPLDVAAQFGHDDAVQLMLEFASPKQRFLAACVSADAALARGLLAADPGLLDTLDVDERRTLPAAAWAGNAAAVRLMLDLGFPPDARGGDGGTVLHLAAWRGSLDTVRAALAHDRVRALLEDRDPTHGSTPLGWCCHGATFARGPGSDHPGVAVALLEAGAEAPPGVEASVPPDVQEAIRRWRSGGA